MLRPVAPDPELVKWLWSYEGQVWHQKNIFRVRHAQGAFAEVKYDHECDPDSCSVAAYSPHPDSMIWAELEKYGIYGVPEEWKQREVCS